MIKLFNEYYSVKLYTEINHWEWEEGVDFDDYNKFKYESFLKSEKEEIISVLRGLGYSRSTILGDLATRDHLNYIFNLFGDDGIFITKLSDEWFYVYDKVKFQFYKCDQFDGLLQCLKDIAPLVGLYN